MAKQQASSKQTRSAARKKGNAPEPTHPPEAPPGRAVEQPDDEQLEDEARQPVARGTFQAVDSDDEEEDVQSDQQREGQPTSDEDDDALQQHDGGHAGHTTDVAAGATTALTNNDSSEKGLLLSALGAIGRDLDFNGLMQLIQYAKQLRDGTLDENPREKFTRLVVDKMLDALTEVHDATHDARRAPVLDMKLGISGVTILNTRTMQEMVKAFVAERPKLKVEDVRKWFCDDWPVDEKKIAPKIKGMTGSKEYSGLHDLANRTTISLMGRRKKDARAAYETAGGKAHDDQWRADNFDSNNESKTGWRDAVTQDVDFKTNKPVMRTVPFAAPHFLAGLVAYYQLARKGPGGGYNVTDKQLAHFCSLVREWLCGTEKPETTGGSRTAAHARLGQELAVVHGAGDATYQHNPAVQLRQSKMAPGTPLSKVLTGTGWQWLEVLHNVRVNMLPHTAAGASRTNSTASVPLEASGKRAAATPASGDSNTSKRAKATTAPATPAASAGAAAGTARVTGTGSAGAARTGGDGGGGGASAGNITGGGGGGEAGATAASRRARTVRGASAQQQ